LFDSDDDNKNEKDSLWNEDEFKVKKCKKVSIWYFVFFNNDTNSIYLCSQTTLGNDARFILDDRFIEDNNQTKESKVVEDTDECSLQKEKEKQLDILENILGTPLTIKNLETKPTK